MVERVNIGDGNTEQDWLISPLVTVPANGQLRFYGLHGRAGDQGSKLKIKISTTSGAQTTLANFTIEVASLTETQVSPVAGEYREVVVNLTPAVAANQQVYIAFVREHTQVGTAADGDRFVIDDINMVQRCLDPTNGVANNVTTNSAILSWTNPSGSTQWEVELIPSTDAFTGTGQIVNSNPYTATTTATGAPIAPGTVYQYKVRSICTGGVPSDWAGPFYFTTVTLGQTCAAPITINQLPYSTTDNTSNYGNNISGSQGTTGCGTTTNYLTGNDVVYAYTATFTGNIDISMTPTATYSGIFVYNNCANIGTSCLAGIGNSNSNIRNIPNFPVTAGTTYYFVISTNATPQTTGYTLIIQRVTCTPPGALAVAGITMNSANLSWSNPSSGTEWEVVVQALGAGIPQGAGTAVTTGPAYVATTTVTGTPLASGTDYEYYVRVKCPDGSYSQWSGPKPFKTLPNYCAGDHFFDPGGPNGQYANSANVTTTICPTNPGDIVTVTFNSFDTESGYDFVRVYNGPNATSPLLGTYSGNLTGANLPGPFESSGPGACLTFVFTSDGSGIRDGWDATVTCGPPPTCPKPKNLSATNMTQTSADLNWQEMGTATQWEVIVLPAGSAPPAPGATGVIVNTPPPFTYSGPPALLPGRPYDFYVRAICSASDISAWSIKGTFRTLISNDECTAPIHVPVNEDSLCGQTTPGTLAGATASALPNTCGGNPNDDVWFEFTATHTQHYIALLNTTSTGLNTDNMYHSVYSACGGTPIVCSDPNNSLVNGLVPGQNYLIRVYSNAATAQSFTFNLCVGTVITCADAQAFCANNTSPSITFPGSIGVPNLGTVACLTTTPNPTWYFLQVQQSGNLQFQISQTSTTGQGIDVDFIAYGPFTSPTAGCGNLGANVGCSYSSASVENFNIPNAISGQYYLIEITNYNGSAGNITLAQTNQGQSGAGSTNCDIVCTVDLGPDKILCGQTSYTLDAGIVNATTYTWYNGTNVIPGATGQTLTVTQSGTYSVVVTKPSCSNNPTDSVNITFGPTINQVTMPDYKVCDDISNDGLADFDLSTLTPQVVAGQNPAFTYNVTYHASSADATAGVNPIDATVPYNSNTKTIYIRVEGANSATCFGVIPVNLVVKLMPIVTMPATYSVCTGTVTIIGTPQNYTAANNPTYTWYFGTTVIAGETTDQITVSQAGTYTLEVTVDGCTNSVSTVVTNDGVTVTAPDDVTVCGSYTLPTLASGTYYTGSGATGTVLNAGDVITSTQTIYVYLQ
ncbi:MAG: hypothetical protein E2604_06220, partial [Flavobacterium sp.]|nr:hypothetical protein [Flavobacterium sp.]